MGGVDIHDQLRSYYTPLFRSRRTWFPMFIWLLEVAIINSFRTWQALFGDKSTTHFRFRENIANQLLELAAKLEHTANSPDTTTSQRAVCATSPPKKRHRVTAATVRDPGSDGVATSVYDPSVHGLRTTRTRPPQNCEYCSRIPLNKEVARLRAQDVKARLDYEDARKRGMAVAPVPQKLTPARREELKSLYRFRTKQYCNVCQVFLHGAQGNKASCFDFYHKWADPPADYIETRLAARIKRRRVASTPGH